MFPRNLQNVSKTASHSNKYGLFHANKRNLILNNILHSTPSINKNKSQSSNTCITYNQKYCYSKIKQTKNDKSATNTSKFSNLMSSIQSNKGSSSNSVDKSILTTNLKDIIPSNLNLSDSEHSNIQNVLDYLSKTGQTKIVQFISEQLRKSIPQTLSKSSINFLTENEQIITNAKDKIGETNPTYIKLSFIESTPKHSIETAKNQIKTASDNDIVHGIHRSSIIINEKGENCIYHGWINTTSSKNNNKIIAPKEVKSFVNTLKEKENIKQQTITIAIIDQKLKKDLKTFKDFIIYALSLEGENGGFHKSPKFASHPQNIDSKPDITSTKVIAKSTEMSWEDEDDTNMEIDDDVDSGTIYDQVDKIHKQLEDRTKKQDYRAKHLNNWQNGLQNRETQVSNDKKHIEEIDSNMKNREENIENESQELSKLSNDLKWRDLKHKRNSSDIEYKKQTLLNVENKLNEQQKEQICIMDNLNKRETDINNKEIKLNEQNKKLIENENNITQKENKLNTQIKKLKIDNEKYEKNKALLEKQRLEIQNEKKDLMNEKLTIEKERNILNKDTNEWNEKVKAFKQRDAKLNELETKFANERNEINQQKEEIKTDKENIRINTKQNENKYNELELKGNELSMRDTKLSERENDLKCKQNLLNNKQNEFNKLEKELKENENRYNIEKQKLKNDKLTFEKDRNEFDITQKQFDKQQKEYNIQNKELKKEQLLLNTQLKNMEEEKLKMDKLKEEMIQKQNKFDSDKIQLNKDTKWLDKEINLLKTQQNQFKQDKIEIETKEKHINQQFVQFNNERNIYQNDKIKTQQFENELNKKQNELNVKIKNNEEKSIDITNKYNELKKEETEIMNKIEPIKYQEKELNKKQQLLNEKEKSNTQQLEYIKTEKIKIEQTQKNLESEAIELKKEEYKLNSLDKQLEKKQIKISDYDKRITNMYDEFNKTKYKVSKLEQVLNVKENDIIQREQKLNEKQQMFDKNQMDINQQKEIMIEKKKEFETLKNNFDMTQKKFDIQQKEYEKHFDRLKCDQLELDKINKSYIENQKLFDEEKMRFISEQNMIIEQKDYIKQQNQSLSAQKRILDNEKLKLEQNGLLLATRTQELQQQEEQLKCDYSKLDKINTDLKGAQMTHKQEDEKLREYKNNLENEQQKLNEWEQQLMTRTKHLDATAMKLNEQELQLQKLTTSVENRNKEMNLNLEKMDDIKKKENSLNKEYDSLKKKEELIEISKEQIIMQQQEIINKEKQLSKDTIELNQKLKDVNDTKTKLTIEMTKKESELSTKQITITDKDLNISKLEREIKQKDIILKNKENELKEKEYTLLNLQKDLDINKAQIRTEIKKNKDAINNEKLEIETEKNNLLQQKENIEKQKLIQSEHEKELSIQIDILKNKCDELQNEIYEIEYDNSLINNKLNCLTDQNNELIKEKQILNDKIIETEKLEKQLKRPIDLQQRLISQEKMENYKQEEYVKHLMSSLKKKENIIESKQNKINKQENDLVTQIEIQKQKEIDIDLMKHNVNKELDAMNKMKQDVDNEKQIYEEKLKLTSELQQNFEKAQDSLGQKDIIINQLQNKYSNVNSKYIKQKNIQINLKRMQNKVNHQNVLINKLQNENRQLKKNIEQQIIIESKVDESMQLIHVPLSSADMSLVSQRNMPKSSLYIEPKSIPITGTETSLQTETIVSKPTQPISIAKVDMALAEPITMISKHNTFKTSSFIEPESIPITATPLTESSISTPLTTAEPTSIVSKHNQQSFETFITSSIPINIPCEQYKTYKIEPSITPSVPLTTAAQTSQMSKHNIDKLASYIQPQSIDINIALTPTFNDLTSPQGRLLSVEDERDELRPEKEQASVEPFVRRFSPLPQTEIHSAQPISLLSRTNTSQTKYAIPQSIDISEPYVKPKDDVLSTVPLFTADSLVPHSRFNMFEFPNKIVPQSIQITKIAIPLQTETIVSQPIHKAEPINIISKYNHPLFDKIIPKSIPINIPVDPHIDAYTTKVNMNSAEPTTMISKCNMFKKQSFIEPKSIPITEITIPLQTETSVCQPINKAEPISIISKYNQPLLNKRIAKSIAISIPVEVLGPKVNLNSAEPTTMISKYNAFKKLSFIKPKCISITGVEYVSPESVCVSLCGAEPTSTLSRYNADKLLKDDITKRIPVTSILEATDNLLSPFDSATQQPQQHIDMDGLKRGIQGLKELDESQDTTTTEPKIEMETELKLQSKLNVNDLDALFQCTTNKDLLFDDIEHIDTVFCGLNNELQNYLMECRDYKSMIKPLPSQFKSNITDFDEGMDDIFTGDVICCLQWKFDNDQYNNLCNDIIPNLITTCNKAIDNNRELIKQYNIAIKDNKKRSMSNRNKLRPNNKFSNRNKMSIFDINENKNGEFKNDLHSELLALQYQNSEWLLLQSMLHEWNEYIEKLKDIDSTAFNTSNYLYLRSFCILPSQTIDERNSDYLSNELKHRQWVREFNNLLKNSLVNNDDNFDLYYSEMGDRNNWKDKLLVRDLMSYLLNGINFELNSENSKYIPLSEGFIRIGYQSQLLIESVQSLLGYIDPYVEQIITCSQDWVTRDNNINSGNNRENIELSLQNGQELTKIDVYSFPKWKSKTPLERAKLVETDIKYTALFKDPLSTDLNTLLSQNEIDGVYVKKLHQFLRSYFEKLYRDELMLPTPNSTILEETATETWQKHALLEAVCNDKFYDILKLLSNKTIAQQICDFISYNVYDMNKEHLNSNEQQNRSLKMYNEMFKPFEIFKEYYEINVKQKMYEIISDFDIQQYLSDNIYQITLKNKLENENINDKNELWYNMKYANRALKPQQFKRDYDMKDVEMPEFTEEERLATYWTGYLKGVLNGVPIERPIRLPEQYHDIDNATGDNDDVGYLKHLKQHYYIDSYKPPSHEDTAERISIEDKMNGVDIYRDQYIQRPHQSKRILQTKLQFLFHNKLDYMKGAFPLENFHSLPWGSKKPTKHRVTVRKSTFVQARAQENYETRIYTKIATNYKLTSNRTADMFNARGFDLIYDSVRVI